jgi:hypothetical protein
MARFGGELRGAQRQGRSMRGTGIIREGVGALALALAIALIAAAQNASALSQRGHEFSKDVSIPSEAALLEPAGVAVGEAEHSVYVADKGHNRIEQFGTDGTFISAWGWGVKGGSEYAVCKTGEGCLPGAAKKPAGMPEAFQAPSSLAVDNSTEATDPSRGDVYVANSKGKGTVDKFGPKGEFIGTVFGKQEAKEIAEEEFGRIDGVAIDTRGALWVAWQSGAITHYTNGVENERVLEPEVFYEPFAPVFPRPGFAVNSRGDLYIDVEPGGSEEAKHPCETVPCNVLALRDDGEGEFLPELGEAFTEGFGGATATGVAVDETTDNVYVAHPTFISAYDSHQGFVQKFGEGHLTRTGGIGIDGQSQDAFVSDATTGALEVYVPEAAVAAPTVDALSPHGITSSTAEPSAQIDPRGAATTVTFEFGAGSCSGGGCTALEAEAIPAGFGDQERHVALPGLAPGTTYALRVTAKSSAGEASRETTFTTRPVPLPDGRAWELVSPTHANGANYEAAPSEGGIIRASEDGSALTYLATAPTEAGAQGNRAPSFSQNLARRVSDQGNGKPAWSSQDIEIPAPEKTPGVTIGATQEYAAFSRDLGLAIIQPYNSSNLAEPALSKFVNKQEEKEAEEGKPQEKTLYLRRNEGACFPVPSSCYEALVTAANDKGEVGGAPSHFGGKSGVTASGLRFEGASADTQHVVFVSGFNGPEAPLTAGPSAKGANLYEWNRSEPESLKPVNLLPLLKPGEEERAAGGEQPATLGSAGKLVRNAVSEDGSHIYWQWRGHLYLRDTTSSETVQIDAPVGEELPGGALYQGASMDGRRVFFTDREPLTPNSHAEQGRRDLFVWEQTTAPDEPLAGTLTDLSVPVEAGGHASVKGLVPALSEQGDVVYFAAANILANNANAEGEKATRGGCTNGEQTGTTTCNLYVDRLTGETWKTTFIARLAGADSPDWGFTDESSNLQKETASSSPDGEYFAFMSKRPLIRSYDNRVTSPAGDGAHAEEVYLYGAGDGRLVCGSCEPDGSRPAGVADLEESGEGLGLLVDRDRTWTTESQTNPVWLAGSIPGWTGQLENGAKALQPPRVVSNEGRLFFNSPDSLVPADENQKNDVYQYEPDGLGSCASATGCVALISAGTSDRESAFLEASATGEDVFFLSAAPLVPADINGAYDVYDARVCTAASPCVEAQAAVDSECESASTCRGTPPTTAPAIATAPTTSTGPSGNTPRVTVLSEKASKPPTVKKPLTRSQKLAKALKACKKIKAKSKRKSCEKQAHKKYGPSSKKKKK